MSEMKRCTKCGRKLFPCYQSTWRMNANGTATHKRGGCAKMAASIARNRAESRRVEATRIYMASKVH